MTTANGTLPKAKISKTEMARRVITNRLGGPPLNNDEVAKLVRREFGVKIKSADAMNARSSLRKAAQASAGSGTPKLIKAVPASKPLPEPKTSAVELIKVTRIAIAAAGSKEALKELIDVL